MKKAAEAIAMLQVWSLPCELATASTGKVHLDRLIRAAESQHFGYFGCPDLAYGELPMQPSRDLRLTPWRRQKAYAFAVDVIRGRILQHAHVTRSGGAFPLSRVFEGGRVGLWLGLDDAVELLRAMNDLALGLRVMARRDKTVFARMYASAEAKQPDSTLGPVNWFVAWRNGAGLDRLRTWLTGLARGEGLVAPGQTTTRSVTVVAAAASASAAGSGAASAASAATAAAGAGAAGGGASGAGAAGAGAAASGGGGGASARPASRQELVVDLSHIASQLPWVKVACAITQRGAGDADPGDVVQTMWRSVAAGEAMACQAVEIVTKAKATNPSKRARPDDGGDAAAAAPPARSTRRGAVSGGGGRGAPNTQQHTGGGGGGSGGGRGPGNAGGARGGRGSGGRAGGRGGGGGGGGGGGNQQPPRGNNAAAPDGLPTSGVAATVAAARRALGGVAIDQWTIQDCRAADLCRRCKYPFHGAGCTQQLRGQQL